MAYKDKEREQEYLKNYRETHKEEAKIYREVHREKILEQIKEYRHKNRNKILEQDRYYHYKNREKYLKQAKEYRRLNKEKIKFYKKSPKGKLLSKIYKNKRRALKLKTQVEPVTIKMLQSRFKFFGNKCVYCGKKDALTMDHIIPLSKGGPHIIENIVPSCGSCNSSKHNKLLQEWKPEIIPILEEKIGEINA